ncbi:hypothetical protein GMI69_02260 [Eggerthellaceae bacterium zg-887]|uniref:TorD/DmsD family molecular chaperone n=1 Tax=Xiamenia xianingshaonis TaxID=2682776 RepID=UPI00140CD578|nr:molecular chaperone TorD family protein [Xiamenia xianingshaonis]NHM15497.1 hypothetical protein [Xiamenia xianingshaonis]
MNEHRPEEGPAENAWWRAGLYQVAAEAFLQEPTDEQLKGQIASARSALQAESGWKLACEKELLAHLASLDENDEDLGRRVRSEYAELFVGPRPPLAPLYESLYHGRNRRLLSETTREVREFYERCGLAVVRKNRIPDDHVGYELEFMSKLYARLAEAHEANDESQVQRWRSAQDAFLADHLGAWIPAWLERMQRTDATHYLAWAEFVVAFVAHDAEERGLHAHE